MELGLHKMRAHLRRPGLSRPAAWARDRLDRTCRNLKIILFYRKSSVACPTDLHLIPFDNWTILGHGTPQMQPLLKTSFDKLATWFKFLAVTNAAAGPNQPFNNSAFYC